MNTPNLVLKLVLKKFGNMSIPTERGIAYQNHQLGNEKPKLKKEKNDFIKISKVFKHPITKYI